MLRNLILLVLFTFMTVQAQTQQSVIVETTKPKIRIACIGNSITFGSGVVNIEKNNYPTQLQNMLGKSYEVCNFGVSGATLLKNGNFPYWNSDAYKKALSSKPDIVFIKLGTNDSKAINRPYYDSFVRDFSELIQSFRQLPSHPRIILLSPVPSYLDDSTSIYNPVIRKEIIPRIQQVAFENKCELINLYPLFTERVDLFPDKIHPSSLGATLIAKRVYEAVKQIEKPEYDVFKLINYKKSLSSFYGFECADFTFQNRACKIVKPKKAAKGLPWIWRARFWGHEPQTDIALLERGFHLVYCDVAELYGNDESIRIWNAFYKQLQQYGFAKKAVLEGMSRGGVYIYNWALQNPEKVSCIYADAPVLDLKSWPGGKGKGPGSVAEWETFKKDYNLTEEEAISFKNSPLDNAVKIAKLRIPLLHVVGDADEIVPGDENTGPFEAAIIAAGGNITVIHKPGIKHHPHSLANPTPIVNFILSSTGMKTHFASIAAPGSEYRSAAGWKEGNDWWAQYDDIESLLKKAKDLDILFVGNSITQGIGGHRNYVAWAPGKQAFDSIFNNYSLESAGISGDRTQHVLWRFQNGSYHLAKPKVLVLTIGVNNFLDDSAEEIAEGIFTNLKWLTKNMKQTNIILTGPLPAGVEPNSVARKKYQQVHAIISQYNFRKVKYFPLHTQFLNPDGKMNLNLYSNDGIHLKPEGYKQWAASLFPVVKSLLEK